MIISALGGFVLAMTAATQLSEAEPTGPQILDPGAWREDLAELVELVKTVHPQPFAMVEESEFDAAAERLHADIEILNDHQIMLRMAGLAGMLEDGHTRLSLPRVREDLAFTYSHSDNERPVSEQLAFGQLPVVLASLADGVFVQRAEPGYEHLIGARIEAFGDISAADALERAGAFVAAENAGGRRLNAADRLMLPELLDALGVSRSECGFELTVAPATDADSVATCLPELPREETNFNRAQPEIYFQVRREEAHPDLVIFDYDQIAGGDAMQVGLEFRDAVEAAVSAQARLVIDLRDNTGGDGTLWRPIATILAQTPQMNEYGRVFVLMGPKTFSAAQSLLNHLERFSFALFVGEPSGSRPDHFGDSRKHRLTRSGLTLRVSTLHWSSGTGGDVRDATQPHIPAPRLSEDMIARRDAALTAVERWRHPGLANMIAEQLRLGQPYNAVNIAYTNMLTAPEDERLAPEAYLEQADALAQLEDGLPSAYMLQFGTFAHPQHGELRRRFEAALEAL